MKIKTEARKKMLGGEPQAGSGKQHRYYSSAGIYKHTFRNPSQAPQPANLILYKTLYSIKKPVSLIFDLIFPLC